jgi:hypothetical protein
MLPLSFLSKRRREAVLDLYNILLAAFLFITPWLFGYPREATHHKTARELEERRAPVLRRPVEPAPRNRT